MFRKLRTAVKIKRIIVAKSKKRIAEAKPKGPGLRSYKRKHKPLLVQLMEKQLICNVCNELNEGLIILQAHRKRKNNLDSNNNALLSQPILPPKAIIFNKD